MMIGLSIRRKIMGIAVVLIVLMNRPSPASSITAPRLQNVDGVLIEAVQLTVSLKPQDESQRMAQREIMAALNKALDARRQRITISQSGVGRCSGVQSCYWDSACSLQLLWSIAITGTLVL
jgi:hypothetical protein